MSRAPSSEYIKCSNCNLNKSIETYYHIEIEPKEGVYESDIHTNYCENCENFTKWFMGKGIRDRNHLGKKSLLDYIREENVIAGEYEREIEVNEHMLKKVDQELIKFEEIKTNFFYRLIYIRKRNSLRRKKEKLVIDLDRLNTVLDWSLNSDSIKFYNKLNPKPKPKCLGCGYDKLFEKPKHTCGGDIYKESKRMSYNDLLYLEKEFLLEYDEYGNVTKYSI